jgi:hypothetical protein
MDIRDDLTAFFDGYSVKPGQEQQFKTAAMRRWSRLPWVQYVFPIETEETVAGFPDVLIHQRVPDEPLYVEMKVCDKRGRVAFQNTQPHFYKMHPAMQIFIVVWDTVFGIPRLFTSEEILRVIGDGKYQGTRNKIIVTLHDLLYRRIIEHAQGKSTV